MDAFATVSDLEAGWRTLNSTEQGVAETLLLRASSTLAAMFARRGIEIDPEDELLSLNLNMVTCNMVRRAMASSAADGISSVQQTVGSTSASAQFYNPDGAFFLSKTDKEILGLLGGGRIGWVPLGGAGDGTA